MSERIGGKDTYKKASEPHESVEEAQREWRDFFAGVFELRLKHKVRDLAMVGAAVVKECERLEVRVFRAEMGDPSLATSLHRAAIGDIELVEREKLGYHDDEDGQDVLPERPSPIVQFTYLNHRGVESSRTVMPLSISFRTSPYHKGEQWFLEAFDLDKKERRDFAMKDISFWRQAK